MTTIKCHYCPDNAEYVISYSTHTGRREFNACEWCMNNRRVMCESMNDEFKFARIESKNEYRGEDIEMTETTFVELKHRARPTFELEGMTLPLYETSAFEKCTKCWAIERNERAHYRITAINCDGSLHNAFDMCESCTNEHVCDLELHGVNYQTEYLTNSDIKDDMTMDELNADAAGYRNGAFIDI